MDVFGSPWPSPPRGLEGLSSDGIPMDSLAELQDNGFEPQIRARSNTWPLPRPENFVEPTEDGESAKCSNQQLSTAGVPPTPNVSSTSSSSSKKNSARRNAWGNLSYADLITQAISSSGDNRLTLSQIYEWMVQNVPYFKDKGDSNSSAGWKNSIRHNLSLHNRFMRVQNEGTGKSSWWMLNPDAKPGNGKSVRRRAASMETSKFEKRRGRAKKRVEALRNAQALGLTNVLNDATPSPSSSVSEGLDLFPESPLHSGSFQLSPDFRQRASSNASSCGRLSPISSVLGVEPDWAFSLNDYAASETTTTATPTAGSVKQGQVLDQLAGSLADELKLQTEYLQGFSNATIHNQPPPPYQPPQPYSLHATVPQTYGLQHGTCLLQTSTRESMSPASGTGMSPSYPHSEPSSDYTMLIGSRAVQRPPSSSPPLTPNPQRLTSHIENTPQTLMGQFMEALNGQTNADDLNINVEQFQGGLDCNVDEVIKHELSMGSSLDFNFPLPHQTSNQPDGTLQTSGAPTSGTHTRGQYTARTSVTPPSWVH